MCRHLEEGDALQKNCKIKWLLLATWGIKKAIRLWRMAWE
jgi:hypothetical protein